MDYQQLIDDIIATIKTNGNGSITGAILQQQMVNTATYAKEASEQSAGGLFEGELGVEIFEDTHTRYDVPLLQKYNVEAKGVHAKEGAVVEADGDTMLEIGVETFVGVADLVDIYVGNQRPEGTAVKVAISYTVLEVRDLSSGVLIDKCSILTTDNTKMMYNFTDTRSMGGSDAVLRHSVKVVQERLHKKGVKEWGTNIDENGVYTDIKADFTDIGVVTKNFTEDVRATIIGADWGAGKDDIILTVQLGNYVNPSVEVLVFNEVGDEVGNAYAAVTDIGAGQVEIVISHGELTDGFHVLHYRMQDYYGNYIYLPPVIVMIEAGSTKRIEAYSLRVDAQKGGLDYVLVEVSKIVVNPSERVELSKIGFAVEGAEDYMIQKIDETKINDYVEDKVALRTSIMSKNPYNNTIHAYNYAFVVEGETDYGAFIASTVVTLAKSKIETL